MGLFDKKECAICGKSVGMLGSRKVEDGTICSDCCKKLSPFFSERKKSTVAEIQQQLQYREQNRENLKYFNATRVLGEKTKVYIDDSQRKFVVSRSSDYKAANADIIDIGQVTSVRYDVDEDRSEIFERDSQGNTRSFNPPRYEYKYDIIVYISVNSPYFSEITVDLTDRNIESRYTEEFRRYEAMANEIVMALNGGMQGGMGMNQPMGGYQQQPPMQGGYQQPMQGGYQQPMQGGYQQQQPMGGYQQQAPMQGGYQQPMQGGYQQPMQQQGYPQQGAYQQPMGAQWFCQSCGAANNGAAGFCANCGAPKA